MKPILGLATIIFFEVGLAFGQSDQSLALAKKLETEGKLKDAAVAYKSELMKAGDTSQLSLVAKIVDIDPDLVHVEMLLSQIAGDHPKAEIREAAWVSLANLAIASNRLATARASYRAAAAILGKPELRLQAVALALYFGEYDTVRQGLDEVIGQDLSPSLVQKTALLSAIYLARLNRPQDAWELLDSQVLSLGTGSVEAVSYGVVLARQLGLTGRATALAKELTKRFGNHPLLTVAETAPVFAVLVGGSWSHNQDPVPTAVDNVATAKGPRAIQIGLYASQENATAYQNRVKQKTQGFRLSQEKSGDKFRVLVVLQPNDDPDKVMLRLKSAGIEGFLLF